MSPRNSWYTSSRAAQKAENDAKQKILNPQAQKIKLFLSQSTQILFPDLEKEKQSNPRDLLQKYLAAWHVHSGISPLYTTCKASETSVSPLQKASFTTTHSIYEGHDTQQAPSNATAAEASTT